MMCNKAKKTSNVTDNNAEPQVLDKHGSPIKKGDKILFDGMEFLVDNVYTPGCTKGKAEYLNNLVCAKRRYPYPGYDLWDSYLTLCARSQFCELIGTLVEKDKATDTTDHDLKPCPFCGSPRVLGFKLYGGGWYVTCDNCGNETSSWGTREEAVRRWNTRAS